MHSDSLNPYNVGGRCQEHPGNMVPVVSLSWVAIPLESLPVIFRWELLPVQIPVSAVLSAVQVGVWTSLIIRVSAVRIS